MNNPSQPRPLHASQGSALKMLTGFALLWNLIAFGATWAVTTKISRELAQGHYAALIVYVFPAVGILLIVNCVRGWQHERRFGNTVLTLDPDPGAIGGQLGGTVDVPSRLPPSTVFRVNVQCLHSRETRDSKGHKSVRESLVWQDDMNGRMRWEGRGSRVQFLFDIPSDLPEPEPRSSSWHHWRLRIQAEVPGVDLDASFELPMRKGMEHSSLRLPGLERERQIARSQKLADVLNMEQQGDTLFMDFPYGRYKSLAAVVFVVGAMFAGGAVMIGYKEAGHGLFSAIPLLMAMMFGMVGLALVVYALYAPFNRLQVAIKGQVLYSRRYWLGWQVSAKQMTVDDVQSLRIDRGASYSSGSRATVFYRVTALASGGRKLRLAEGIPGRVLAEETVRFLQSSSALADVPAEPLSR